MDLTAQERKQVWTSLSEEQQETLNQYKKYQVQSLFLTTNFSEEDHWSFLDFREDPHYPNSDNPLFCRCGRQIKYQFVLVSEETGKVLKLGSTHFAQHLGVDEGIAREIKAGIHQIDRGLDLILRRVQAGFYFPEGLYQKVLVSGLIAKLPENTRSRIEALRAVNLPIYPDDQEALFELLPKQSETTRKWQPKKVNAQAKQNPLQDLMGYLRRVEIGEAIDTKATAEYLQQDEVTIRRWLGLLNKARFPVEVKEVGGEYFRIR